MASTAALDRKVEGNNCWFWIRQADPCTQSIHVATVIVAALSAIAVLGGVLMIMAQQGHHLGGINSLAKNVHPLAIYATVAVAATVLALDSAFIYALIRGYTNQVFSQEEMDELQLLPNLKATEADLQPLHYSVYISHETPETETDRPRPAAYIIQAKNKLGQESVVPFRSEDSLEAHISRLENEGYEPAKEAGFADDLKVSLERIHHLTDIEWLNRKCASLALWLPEGYFTFERITLAKDGYHCNCTLFAAKHEGNPKVEHFVSFILPETSGEVGAEFLSDCVNLEEVKVAVNNARKLHVRKPLDNNKFEGYEVSFIHQIKNQNSNDPERFSKEEKMLYIITYRKNHSLNEITEFFLTDRSRLKRMEKLGFNMA